MLLRFHLPLLLVAAIILLPGCGTAATVTEEPPTVIPATIPATATIRPTEAPPTEEVVPTYDPAVPAILQQPVLENGTLAIIGYTGPEGQCIALSFDTRVFVAQHCGIFAGDGVGFVDTITDPTGASVRVAYGLALNPDISAVAIEFNGAGDAHSFTENGSYFFLLDSGQNPRRATGVNPFGNMVGQWQFN